MLRTSIATLSAALLIAGLSLSPSVQAETLAAPASDSAVVVASPITVAEPAIAADPVVADPVVYVQPAPVYTQTQPVRYYRTRHTTSRHSSRGHRHAILPVAGYEYHTHRAQARTAAGYTSLFAF